MNSIDIYQAGGFCEFGVLLRQSLDLLPHNCWARFTVEALINAFRNLLRLNSCTNFFPKCGFIVFGVFWVPRGWDWSHPRILYSSSIVL